MGNRTSRPRASALKSSERQLPLELPEAQVWLTPPPTTAPIATARSTQLPLRQTIQQQGTAHSHGVSRLLDLPAELRNQIYAYVVLEQEPIKVIDTRPTFERPSLLLVSKQIRLEARGMFYDLNTFEIHAPEFDPAVLLAFYQRCLHSTSTIPSMSIVVIRPTNWSNLLRWMRLWHEGQLPIGFKSSDTDVPLQSAAAGAMELMMQCDRLGISWQNLEKLLAIYKAKTDCYVHWT